MIKVFIGTSAMGEDEVMEKILWKTLHDNTDMELEVDYMRPTNDPASFWYNSPEVAKGLSTPFSNFRWRIPEACDFEGRAIYMDVDIISNRDISELFILDMGDKAMAARKGSRFGGHEFCVMLFDNKKMKDLLRPVEEQRFAVGLHHHYIQKFSGNSEFVFDLDQRWNVHDGKIENNEEIPIEDAWNMHYTNMATQPWKPSWYTGVSQKHPRQDWVDFFEMKKRDMLKDETIPDFEYEENVNYNIIGK